MIEIRISTRANTRKYFRMVLLSNEEWPLLKKVDKDPFSQISFEKLSRISGKHFSNKHIVPEDAEEEIRLLEETLKAVKEHEFDVLIGNMYCV